MISDISRFVASYDLDRRVSFYHRLADLFGMTSVDDLTVDQLEVLGDRMYAFMQLPPTVAVMIATAGRN